MGMPYMPYKMSAAVDQPSPVVANLMGMVGKERELYMRDDRRRKRAATAAANLMEMVGKEREHYVRDDPRKRGFAEEFGFSEETGQIMADTLATVIDTFSTNLSLPQRKKAI